MDKYPHGFTWQLVGGINVAVPNPAPARPLLPSYTPPRVDLIACPACGARIDEPCRSSGGHYRRTHPARLIPRRCSCGGKIVGRSAYCEPCKRKVRKSTKREAQRRIAAKKKAAA